MPSTTRLWKNSLSTLALAALTTGIAVGCGDDDSVDDSPAGEQAQQHYLRGFITRDFEREDGNSNGFISRPEAIATMKIDFVDADINRDRLLTIADVQQELAKSGGGMAEKPLEYYLPYDGNGDGRITKREYVRAVTRQFFNPMDTDGDGSVSLQEAVIFHETAGSRRPR